MAPSTVIGRLASSRGGSAFNYGFIGNFAGFRISAHGALSDGMFCHIAVYLILLVGVRADALHAHEHRLFSACIQIFDMISPLW